MAKQSKTIEGTVMKKGLVLGKFMPLHFGHIGLIAFASSHCDYLTILLCHYLAEPISGAQRLSWLKDVFAGNPKIEIRSYAYDPELLPDSSEPKPEYARLWAEKIKTLVPDVAVFFSSETYGENVAACLNIEHLVYDKARKQFPVAASQIRQKPFTYWHFLPQVVQPYFVKKVVLVGSESTGKSVLTERLASFYQTVYVPEKARDIIDHTDECTVEHLEQIAVLHAQTILAEAKKANKILFCDTDLNITKSYSKFLFKQALLVPDWIEAANKFDLYIFLETDCPYIQDGTRLSEQERNELSLFHKQQLDQAAINYTTIAGDWDKRFAGACDLINKTFLRT